MAQAVAAGCTGWAASSVAGSEVCLEISWDRQRHIYRASSLKSGVETEEAGRKSRQVTTL
jgi:hypothetical protein